VCTSPFHAAASTDGKHRSRRRSVTANGRDSESADAQQSAVSSGAGTGFTARSDAAARDDGFPHGCAGNPYAFAALVQAKLGDDKRLVRIYGTNTVIARLTGDRTRARLFLLSYAASRRQQRDNLQAMRVRVLGRYQPTLAAYGAEQDTALTDIRHPDTATEFWIPDFSVIAIIDLKGAQ
jgi:hypothetical protein